MVTETDRNKARSAVVSAYHALDCVTIPFSFLHAFADAAVDAVSTDAEPFGWTSKHFNEGEEHRKWGRRRENVASYEGYIVQALYADPVKTAPAVAVKALCSSPMIESLTPTTKDWESCESIQDRYDLMKRLIRSALSAQVQNMPTARDALQVIANLPTGDNLDVCQGQEEAYRAVEALFSEAPHIEAQVQDVGGWQPIETAPEDGSKFLFIEASGRIQVGRMDAEWGGEKSVFVCLATASDWYPSVNPTHWMPLPASPASKHGDAE